MIDEAGNGSAKFGFECDDKMVSGVVNHSTSYWGCVDEDRQTCIIFLHANSPSRRKGGQGQASSFKTYWELNLLL